MLCQSFSSSRVNRWPSIDLLRIGAGRAERKNSRTSSLKLSSSVVKRNSIGECHPVTRSGAPRAGAATPWFVTIGERCSIFKPWHTRSAMRTVRELIERNALSFPNREALVCGERRLTHSAYALRARRLASGLHRLGLRRQDRVAVLAMNCVEIYETYAAAEVGGYIAVPINFRLAPPEIIQVLRDCGARTLIFESQYTQTVARLRAESTGLTHYICIG